MRRLIVRSLALSILLFLFVPTLFANEGSVTVEGGKVTIEASVSSTALLTFTYDGVEYQIEVPVTIEIDSKLPLSDSSLSFDSGTRIGNFAFEVLGVQRRESFETSGFWGKTYTPSADNHKLLLVGLRLTNVGIGPSKFHVGDLDTFSHDEGLIGFDAVGRQFEPVDIIGCDEQISPLGSLSCLAIFDVNEQVTLTRIEFRAMDRGFVPVPAGN